MSEPSYRIARMITPGLTLYEVEFRIRSAAESDVPAITDLVIELGYQATQRDTRTRLAGVVEAPGHAVLVAADETRVAGWVHVFESRRVESDGFAELGGLVVAARYRGRGLGTQLIAAAEMWARDRGFRTVRIRSRIERTETHRFFKNHGYSRAKTQAIYERLLEEPETTEFQE